MEMYWELRQWDGTVTMIPPQYRDLVLRKWKAGEPIDMGNNGTISAKSISSFHPSNRPYGAQQLLEAASQIFNEPVINPDGSIQSVWVKRPVSQSWWEKHYSRIPSYKRLHDEDGQVIIAFRMATHEVDVSGTLRRCDEDEVKKLTHG